MGIYNFIRNSNLKQLRKYGLKVIHKDKFDEQIEKDTKNVIILLKIFGILFSIWIGIFAFIFAIVSAILLFS